jgi:hypothetical protein
LYSVAGKLAMGFEAAGKADVLEPTNISLAAVLSIEVFADGDSFMEYCF